MHQGNSSVSEFYTQFKIVWNELHDANPLPYCTCNKCKCNVTKRIHTRNQEQKLIQFMMKLNEVLSTVNKN